MNLLLGLGRLFAGPMLEAARVAPAAHPSGTAMQLDDDLLLSDELPPEAKALLEEADRAILAVRQKTDRAVAAVRADADRRIEQIKAEAEAAVTGIQTEAAKELSPLLRDTFARLKAMQGEFLRQGLLDEALAVRNRLRGMRSDLFGVRPDPGNLTEFGVSDAGKCVLFEVVGSTDGSIWGTDAYTGDSRLAVAAVHSGAVRVGERALVRVTLIDGGERTFDGSERYGVRSLDYGNYSLGYRVERV
jgi:predicted regulator of Ras-like GTPase activity (Roadblock/LC7/MglB family)